MSTTDPKRPPRRPGLERTEIDADRPIAVASEGVIAEERMPVEPGGRGEPAPLHLGPGVRIEQYELIRELGRGGMGQVFLARDTRLGRRVAMKFLVASSPRFTERFKVEARATARCSHENIVVIHDVDEYDGMPYMVLEYVEGTTLKKLMADKRLPVGRAIELIVPVVRALARAHEANIIHRDLKPENILVTLSGTIKVLDFGIAKLFSSPEPMLRQRPPSAPPNMPITATRSGAIVGTLPYMSPEQLGTDSVDHRSDLWAVGIILFEMLAGKHPLDPVTEGRLFGAAAMVDEPMPSLADEVPGLPDALGQIVARCLAKTKTARYATAAELCADLEPLLPRRAGRHLVTDESPYPGLTAFQESDANRFFGRAQDIAEIVTRLRDQPLVGVVGPSGVGKSSLVRAGVVPALKSSGDPWEVMIIRPGRQPLSALASTLESLRESRDSDPVLGGDLATILRTEPGTFGTRLRARARRKRSQILLFVDQHEELYTLVTDAAERRAFTACLAAAGDDPSGPLRVVVSMRSDFLDRAAEDRRFVDELTRALVFLQPPSRAGLEAALTQPLSSLGFGFEAGIVDDMLSTLEATPGSLPLLQFSAAKLWDTRDPKRRVLTRDSYHAMGGVGGALAAHADEVFAGLTPPDQLLVRAIFQRLVTPERTRAMVDLSELRDISLEVERLITHLVAARLLVVHARGDSDGSGVELVHESLIKSWPALRRWLDENNDDSAFLAHVRTAAKQWDAKGRPQGLLWRGEAIEEARLWRGRFRGEIPHREADFLEAGIELATRAARVKRRAVVATIAFLGILLAAAGIALVMITSAQRETERQRKEAVVAKEAAIESEQKAVEATRTAVSATQAAVASEEKALAALAKEQAATKAAALAQASEKKTKVKLTTTETRLTSTETALAKAARLAREKKALDAANAKADAARRGKITKTLD